MDSGRLYAGTRHVSLPIHDLDFQAKVPMIPSIPQFQDLETIPNQQQDNTGHPINNSNSDRSISQPPFTSHQPHQRPHSDGWVHPLARSPTQYQTFQQQHHHQHSETDDTQYLSNEISDCNGGNTFPV